MRSSSLLSIDNMEIGRKFSTNERSWDFGTGVIWPFFHSVGNLPSQIDWLNIAVTAGVML